MDRYMDKYIYDSSHHEASPRYPTTLRLTGLEPITFVSIVLFIIFFVQLIFLFLAPFFRLLLAPIGLGTGLGTAGGLGGAGASSGGFGGAGGGFGGAGGGGINGFLGIGNGLNFGLVPGLLGANGLLNTGLLGPTGLLGTGLLNSGLLGLGGLGAGAGGGGAGAAGGTRVSRFGVKNGTASARRSKSSKFNEENVKMKPSVIIKSIEPHYCSNEAVCYTIRSTRIT